MNYLKELCPNARQLDTGVFIGTCVESAFLISYPKAKLEYPQARIQIVMGEEHAILLAGDVVYDPIADALMELGGYEDVLEMYSRCRHRGEIIEEADFSEWWTINMLGCQYHPSCDYIADLLG